MLLIRYYRKKGVKHIYFVPFLGFWYYLFNGFRNHGDSIYFLKQFIQKYPDAKFLVTNIGADIHFILFDSVYIKNLLVNHISNITVDHDHPFDPLFGPKNIVWSEKNDWKIRRKLLSSGFTFENLTKSTPMIIESVSKHLDKLGEGELKSIDIVKTFRSIAGCNILNCFLGGNLINKQTEGLILENYQISLVESVMNRVLNPIFLIFGKKYHNHAFFGEAKRINEKCRDYHQMISDEISFQKQLIYENKILKNDYKFIHHVIQSLETQNELKKSDIDLAYEFITIFSDEMFTATHFLLISWMFLSDYPEVVNKILKEAEFIKSDEELSQHLNELNYLSAVIKEILRMKTPVPLGVLKKIDKDCLFEDLLIKKDTSFQVFYHANNMNSKFFEEPQTFNPDRWIDNKGNIIELKDTFAYCPFSLGPRNCIGQHFALIEIKISLLKFFKKFAFKMIPDNNIKWIFSGLYVPDRTVFFDLSPR